MPRSIKVRAECIDMVKGRLRRNSFFSQFELAQDLELSESTIHSFLNGKPVDNSNFREISEKLGLDVDDIADKEEPIKKNTISRKQLQEPLPSADFPSPTVLEYPKGQVPLDSRFYIERPPIEERCYTEIYQPGSLIRIKAPQQMGKSSLLARIIQQAKIQGDATVIVDLTLIEEEFLVNLNTFLRCFCANVVQELTQDNQTLQENLLNNLDKHWHLAQRIGCMKTCKDYFERYLLSEMNQSITLALENVDKLFEYPKIYRDFFSLLRSFHEDAKSRDIWKKLRLAIVHSTEAYVPMDINQSPFNVGLVVELLDLTQEQVKDLAQRHQFDWSDTEIESFMAMVGGHPYLVRIAMYKIAENEISLEQLLTTPAIEGIFSSHLRDLEFFLKQQPELESTLKELLDSDDVVNVSNEIKYKLRALGLVRLEGDRMNISCELYRQYF